ncbi:MAG: putative replicase [Cressdnaviricota sp.]|nr:MAG: putative replicase [Cressdnaviricota sp.]
MLNYDDAYHECCERIKRCRTRIVSCGYCHHCVFPKKDTPCLKKSTIYCINEECLKPVQIFEECINDDLKKTTKKALQKNHEKGTTIPLEYVWLTINPRFSVTFERFRKKVFAFLTNTTFHSHCAVFEQRGTIEQGDVGRGFHAHILFKRHLPLNKGKTPSDLKRNLKQSFKNYCDTKQNSCFNIRFIGTDFAYDKLDYIKGTKTGIGKDLIKKDVKQLADVVWRKQNNLEPFYGSLF